jgi:hypothetical protein
MMATIATSHMFFRPDGPMFDFHRADASLPSPHPLCLKEILMNDLIFEDRAVAFVDVLGFSALTSKAAEEESSLRQLKDLVGLLDSSIPTLDAEVSETVPKELIPRHNYISDCVILSAPMSVRLAGWSHYDGLGIVVMRVIQLTHKLLDAGYLVRGGISVGRVWHSESNIIGPAYMEAYGLEGNAKAPRVVLSGGAKAYWNNRRANWSRMCIDYKGVFMVNGLHEHYIPGGDDERAAAFARYASTVDDMTNRNLPAQVSEKWRWFQQYLSDELRYVVPST